MVPIGKVKEIINKHISLEKELSAGNIDILQFYHGDVWQIRGRDVQGRR